MAGVPENAILEDGALPKQGYHHIKTRMDYRFASFSNKNQDSVHFHSGVWRRPTC